MSARYSVLDREFYIPEPQHLAAQATMNRQGRGDVLEGHEAEAVLALLRHDAEACYRSYAWMLNDGSGDDRPDPQRAGLARELARMNLTLNTYTQWYWKTNLHNLMHFLGLRAEKHAQLEIRVYADMMLEIMRTWVPATHQPRIPLPVLRELRGPEIRPRLRDAAGGTALVGMPKASMHEYGFLTLGKRDIWTAWNPR